MFDDQVYDVGFHFFVLVLVVIVPDGKFTASAPIHPTHHLLELVEVPRVDAYEYTFVNLRPGY